MSSLPIAEASVDIWLTLFVYVMIHLSGITFIALCHIWRETFSCNAFEKVAHKSSWMEANLQTQRMWLMLSPHLTRPWNLNAFISASWVIRVHLKGKTRWGITTRLGSEAVRNLLHLSSADCRCAAAVAVQYVGWRGGGDGGCKSLRAEWAWLIAQILAGHYSIHRYWLSLLNKHHL